MSDVQLGTVPKMPDLLEKSIDYRDAVHVAVVPMRSQYQVVSGERMKVITQGYCRPAYPNEPPDGIVDPFLPEKKEPMQSGTWFWLLLMPGTVTGMRHHWQHPVFDRFAQERGAAAPTSSPISDEQDSGKIPEVVLEIARICGKTYEALMSDAGKYVESGWPVMDNSQRYDNVSGEQWAAFWGHYREVVGNPGKYAVDAADDVVGYAPYTCSC